MNAQERAAAEADRNAAEQSEDPWAWEGESQAEETEPALASSPVDPEPNVYCGGCELVVPREEARYSDDAGEWTCESCISVYEAEVALSLAGEAGGPDDVEDDDPRCVCGVYRSEHSVLGCPEGFQTPAQWEVERQRIRDEAMHEDDYGPEDDYEDPEAEARYYRAADRYLDEHEVDDEDPLAGLIYVEHKDGGSVLLPDPRHASLAEVFGLSVDEIAARVSLPEEERRYRAAYAPRSFSDVAIDLHNAHPSA